MNLVLWLILMVALVTYCSVQWAVLSWSVQQCYCMPTTYCCCIVGARCFALSCSGRLSRRRNAANELLSILVILMARRASKRSYLFGRRAGHLLLSFYVFVAFYASEGRGEKRSVLLSG